MVRCFQVKQLKLETIHEITSCVCAKARYIINNVYKTTGKKISTSVWERDWACKWLLNFNNWERKININKNIFNNHKYKTYTFCLGILTGFIKMRKYITTVIKSESDKQTEEKSTMNIKYNRRIVEVALENQRNKKKENIILAWYKHTTREKQFVKQK